MKTIKLLLSLFALLAITACSSDDEPDIVEPHDPAFTFRFSDNGTLTVNGLKSRTLRCMLSGRRMYRAAMQRCLTSR